jgi:hypothetical protein
MGWSGPFRWLVAKSCHVLGDGVCDAEEGLRPAVLSLGHV